MPPAIKSSSRAYVGMQSQDSFLASGLEVFELESVFDIFEILICGLCYDCHDLALEILLYFDDFSKYIITSI